MFTIRVIESSTGLPVDYQRVGVMFSGWTRGNTADKRTNSRGEAYFDEKTGHGTVYVNGKSVWEGDLEGLVVVYI